MKYIIKILFVFSIIFSFSSCYNYKNIGLMQDANKKLPQYAKAEYIEYRIRVNDEIIYRIMTSDETISKLISTDNTSTLNGISYRVYTDGTIDLPFVKAIKVAGLTLSEASNAIESRFKDIIPDASIKISLLNKTFTVIGEASTGVFEINREKLTIFQALSISGDISLAGDLKRIKILRETANGTEVLEFDIRPKSIIDSKYYYVYPNDIIYVQRAKSSFYKVANWASFAGVMSSSINLLFTIFYLNN